MGTILDFPMRNLTRNFRDEFLGPVSLIIILRYIHSISSCKKFLGPVLRQGQVCHPRGWRERRRELRNRRNTYHSLMPKEPWVHMKILFLLSPSASQVSQSQQHPNMESPWLYLHKKWRSPLPPDSGPTSLGCLAETWLFNLLHLCQEVIHLEGLRGTGYKWFILVLEEFGHQLSEERWWDEPSKRQGHGMGVTNVKQKEMKTQKLQIWEYSQNTFFKKNKQEG